MVVIVVVVVVVASGEGDYGCVGRSGYLVDLI